MNNYQNEANLSSSVIDLNKLITLIWNEKKTILLSVSIFIILSIGFSLILPDKYRSQVLLTSATETNQQNSLSSFGSLAGLAGISMPNSSNNSAIGIEILKSRIFLKKFIVDNNVAIIGTVIDMFGLTTASDATELYNSSSNPLVAKFTQIASNAIGSLSSSASSYNFQLGVFESSLV